MERATFNQMLRGYIDREEGLVDFVKELIKELYKDNESLYNFVLNEFENNYNYFDDYGCMNSLCCILSHYKRVQEESKKRKEEQDSKNKN